MTANYFPKSNLTTETGEYTIPGPWIVTGVFNYADGPRRIQMELTDIKISPRPVSEQEKS